MAEREERTTGLRSLLSMSKVYDGFQQVIGGKKARKYVVDNFINKFNGERCKVLDIGCGTGYLLDYITKDIEYHGYDLNQTYIDHAKNKYGERGSFYCERVRNMELSENEKFDFVIAMGLIHHLNDQESIDLFSLAFNALKKNGKFLTLDGVFTNEQSNLAKYILNNDRGKHVRTEKEYIVLAKSHFDIIDSEVTDDLFTIPYTACILSCTK